MYVTNEWSASFSLEFLYLSKSKAPKKLLVYSIPDIPLHYETFVKKKKRKKIIREKNFYFFKSAFE